VSAPAEAAGRIEVRAGGTPAPAELAAMTAAVAAVLEDEARAAAAAADPRPAAYRSAWRRAAVAEGLRGEAPR